MKCYNSYLGIMSSIRIQGCTDLSHIFRSNPPQMIPSAGSKYWVFRGLAAWFRAKSTTVAGFNGKAVFFVRGSCGKLLLNHTSRDI